MDRYPTNQPSPEEVEAMRLLEARSYFSSFTEQFVGAEEMGRLIDKAEANQEKGLRGVTLPSEDHKTQLVIEDGKVSFKGDGWGPFNVPIDTAKQVVVELLDEETKAKPFWARFIKKITEPI